LPPIRIGHRDQPGTLSCQGAAHAFKGDTPIPASMPGQTDFHVGESRKALAKYHRRRLVTQLTERCANWTPTGHGLKNLLNRDMVRTAERSAGRVFHINQVGAANQGCLGLCGGSNADKQAWPEIVHQASYHKQNFRSLRRLRKFLAFGRIYELLVAGQEIVHVLDVVAVTVIANVVDKSAGHSDDPFGARYRLAVFAQRPGNLILPHADIAMVIIPDHRDILNLPILGLGDLTGNHVWSQMAAILAIAPGVAIREQ
jgi:hypothetical protein